MRLLLISLFCVSVITGIVIFLSFVKPLSIQTNTNILKNYTAQLYFEPQNIYTVCNNASQSAIINLSTNSRSIQSAQIELSYNPAVFYNLSFVPAPHNVLGADNKVDINEIRQNYGRASFVISTKSTSQQTRTGNVVVLYFNTYPQPSSTSAVIEFLNKSTIQGTSSRSSILNETSPLTVHCS